MNKTIYRLGSQAEQAILRFKNEPAIWFKDICNWEPRAPQLVWIEEVLANPFILVVAPPRFGKTMMIEMVNLFETATTAFEEGRTWAPKESQAQDSLKYQLAAIKNSEVLWHYLDWDSGKRQYSSVKYQFINKSNWHIHGIYGEFEGVNATIIRGEEFDDLEIERFENRVIPRGGAKNRNGKQTRIRLTGTIQESKGNIYNADMSKKYAVATKFPVEIGIALGFYDEKIIQLAQENLSEEAYRRIYQLEYVAGRNFVWEEKLEACQAISRQKGWEGQEFVPGSRYQPVGHVFAGFDCGHSGTSETASVFSLQVFEVVGDTVLWLNGKNWVGTTDPVTLIADVVQWWYFFKIERAFGDALKSDLIAQMNDQLYNERLIATDRQKFPENTATNWDLWDFSPKWNTGRAKYIWAGILKNKIERYKILIPRFDAKDDRPIAQAARLFCARLLNVRENTDTKGAYPKLEYINPKLKDDDFDAAIMAMGCMNDHAPSAVSLDLLAGSGRATKFGGFERGIGGQINTDGSENFRIL